MIYYGIFRFQSTLTGGPLKYRRALDAVVYLIIFAGIILGCILLTWFVRGDNAAE